MKTKNSFSFSNWTVPPFLLGVGSVLAQGPSASKSKGHGLHARVAELLNIDEGELTNAFEVAKQEIEEEKRQEKLVWHGGQRVDNRRSSL
ncbi:MAG: hypothetical protein CM1200mP39_19760 [Dehalococcoidia bacterium]|nr:MAG: hypothetical protein CM1200mP39_19760 [Dehalococcoidia bacterium]